MKKMLALSLLAALAGISVACSNAAEKNASNTNTAQPATTANANSPHTTPTGGATTGGTTDEVPAIVRTALPDAQSITKQHKDISASQVVEIEKETATKIKDADHHSYLGFSNTGGTRKQTGAATVVEAGGKQMVVVYESRNGVPYIKELRADGVPQAFLDQFKGKGHDDKLQTGQDIKTQGLDEATAKAAADAIRQDTRIMQALYGGKHSH